MRVTLVIDDELMRVLLERNPGVSKSAAVERAIREYLYKDAYERVRALRGKLNIEDVSAESRRQDRHT